MGRTFFRRANLIDGRNAPKKNATVVVEGQRISRRRYQRRRAQTLRQRRRL